MIEIKNLEFSYSNGPKILDIPELQIEKAEKIFLFGPSGSGKTTLLEAVAGVVSISKGSLKVLGKDFSQMSPSQKDLMRSDHMGYIFQNFNLIPYLTVLENIVLPLYFSVEKRKKVSLEVENRTAEENAKRLGIGNLLSKKVTDLSVGQQQRVAAARALMGSPEIILADEPTSALDYDHREKFIELLFEACRENQTTLVFVSHDRSLMKLFDRTIDLTVMNQAVRQ